MHKTEHLGLKAGRVQLWKLLLLIDTDRILPLLKCSSDRQGETRIYFDYIRITICVGRKAESRCLKV